MHRALPPLGLLRGRRGGRRRRGGGRFAPAAGGEAEQHGDGGQGRGGAKSSSKMVDGLGAQDTRKPPGGGARVLVKSPERLEYGDERDGGGAVAGESRVHGEPV